MTAALTLDQFSVGDWVVFDRVFTPKDFEAFSLLSGDRNALHHDAAFAAQSPFGKTIVPLHLTMAPLSMIAGMIFPGEPSLYLGHDVHAASPVFYGESVRYSARVSAINAANRVLSLRVLALRGMDVLLDATMRVQAQAAQWTTPPALPIRKASERRLALVTGAGGEIGGAIALALARQGFDLLLPIRGADERGEALKERLVKENARAQVIAADIASDAGRKALATALSKSEALSLVVHAASPGITAPVDELAAVNFSALKAIADVAVPQMLAQQRGAVILLGSLATERSLTGWEAYSAAKSMAGNFLAALDRRCSPFGVRGLTVMPGMVATAFSSAWHGEGAMLMPHEVAEAVVAAADHSESSNVLLLDVGRAEWGKSGFHLPAAIRQAPDAPIVHRDREDGGIEPANGVASILRKTFRLGADADLSQAGLGHTPGWDSLKHITLLLDIEAALGVRFASGEIEGVQTYRDLDALVRRKLQAGHG